MGNNLVVFEDDFSSTPYIIKLLGGKIMSCWSKEELENMLEDVVNELDLSESAIAEHGPNGTAPAELVRLVLAEKHKSAESPNPTAWISVEDRLPTTNKEVLVTDGDTSYTVGYYSSHGWCSSNDMLEARNYDGGWLEAGNYDGGCVIDLCETITHWMPLPPLPEHTTDMPCS